MKTAAFFQAFILFAFLTGCRSSEYDTAGLADVMNNKPATRSIHGLLPGNPLDLGAKNYDNASAYWNHMDSVSVRIIPIESQYNVRMFSRQDNEEYVGEQRLLVVNNRYRSTTRKFFSTLFTKPVVSAKKVGLKKADDNITDGYEILTNKETNLIVGAYKYENGVMTQGADAIRNIKNLEKLEDILAGAGFRKTFNENFEFNEETQYGDQPLRAEGDVIHEEDCGYTENGGPWRCATSWIEHHEPDTEDHGDMGPAGDGTGGVGQWQTYPSTPAWTYSSSDTMWSDVGCYTSLYDTFSPSLYDALSYVAQCFGKNVSPSYFCQSISCGKSHIW